MSEKKNVYAFPKLDFFVFYIGLIFTLTIPLYFGLVRQPTEMALAFGIGSVLMAFGNIEKLESFSGAGFKAKLKKRIDKAEVDLDTLKRLVIVLSNPVLSQMAWGDRLGGEPIKNKLLMQKKIIQFMNELNINDEETERLVQTISKLIIFDHMEKIFEIIANDQILDPVIKEKCNEIREKIINTDYLHTSLNVKELRDILKNQNLNNEVFERITDYEYFFTTNKLRRPEKWA